MGQIDWRCCACHYEFRAYDGICPKCLHIISPLHKHPNPKPVWWSLSYLKWFLKEFRRAYINGLFYSHTHRSE